MSGSRQDEAGAGTRGAISRSLKEIPMKIAFRSRMLMAACALAVGIGASWAVFARPCCSSCDPDQPDSRCWAICSPGC